MIWEVTSYSGFSQNSDVPPSDEMIINPLGFYHLAMVCSRIESDHEAHLTGEKRRLELSVTC